ncbi:hypothetical protein ACHHYP_08462 [Achlya hypogyna]|uniref:Man1/Src1-like C-terminal domain-containing protein n=1 Tax=Achlya hypogyna TaxID=1202772 RepID=A0A1V9YPG7_ACHHY|nr:hypothetical protein ACHHYP_08462 [Achlya hypogyna]
MSSLAKAREAAKATQQKRVEAAIAQRSTPSTSSLAEKLKIPAKRKQTATPAKVPAASPPAKKAKVWGACALCHEIGDGVDSQCIFCNAKIHHSCTTPIAAGVGKGVFEKGVAYCSFTCYYNNADRPKPGMFVTPIKTPAREVPTPVRVAATSIRDFATPGRTTGTPATELSTPTKPWQSPTESTSEPWKLKSRAKYVEGDDIKAVLFSHSGVKPRRPRSDSDDNNSDDAAAPLSRRLIPDTTPAKLPRLAPAPKRPLPSPRRPPPSLAAANPTPAKPRPPTPSTTPRRPPHFTEPPPEAPPTPPASRDASPLSPAATPTVKAAGTPAETPTPVPAGRTPGKRHRPKYLKLEKVPTSGSSYPQWVMLLVLLGLAITASLVLTLAYMDALPMCDSGPSEAASLRCHPCPSHGLCFNGALQSCTEPYVLVDRRCVESRAVRQDAALMAELLEGFLMRHASSAFCNASWAELLLIGSAEPQQIVVQNFDLRSYLRTQANWKTASSVGFDASFDKAMTALQTSPRKGSRVITREGNVALTLDDANFACWATLRLHEHVWIYASVLVGALGALYLYKQVQTSKFRRYMYTKMLQAVHAELRHLDDRDDGHVLDGSVSGLRQDILERFFPHDTASREADRLWKSVAAHVQKDARVRERHVMYRGQQVLVWEWLDHRRQKATRIEREEPPLIAGQPINLTS